MNVDEYVALYARERDNGDYRSCGLCGCRVHRDNVHRHVELHHAIAIRSGDAVRVGPTGRDWRIRRSLQREPVQEFRR